MGVGPVVAVRGEELALDARRERGIVALGTREWTDTCVVGQQHQVAAFSALIPRAATTSRSIVSPIP